MGAFIIYSVKAGVCLLVFYLLYKVLLSRETFHKLNRIVLLSVMAASFIFPLGLMKIYVSPPDIPADIVAEPPAGRAVPAVQPVADEMPATGLPAEYAPSASGEKPVWLDFRQLVGVLFWTGAALAFAAMILCAIRVCVIIRSGRRVPIDRRIVLSLTDRRVTPFSWMRYIVMSHDDYAEAGQHIITHEKAHIRSLHSIDLLFADLCGCLQWFNPAMWLIKRELRDIHEYEADRAVIDSGADPAEYQLLLIKKAVGSGRYSIANSLNHSKLKKRITMMLQRRSGLRARMKVLLFVPALLVAVTAFAAREYRLPGNKGSENSMPIIQPGSFSVSGNTIAIPNPYPALGPETLTIKVLHRGEPETGADIPVYYLREDDPAYFSPAMKINDTEIYYCYYVVRDRLSITISDRRMYNIEDRMVCVYLEPTADGFEVEMANLPFRDMIPVRIDGDGNIFVRDEQVNLQNAIETITRMRNENADPSGGIMDGVVLDADDNVRWGVIDALQSLIGPEVMGGHKKQFHALGVWNQYIISGSMRFRMKYDPASPPESPKLIEDGGPVPYYQYFMSTETEEEAAKRLVDIWFWDGKISVDGDIVRPEDVAKVLMRKPAEKGFGAGEMMLGILVSPTARAGEVYRVMNEVHRITPQFGWIVWHD